MPPYDIHTMGRMSIDLTNVRSLTASAGLAGHRVDDYFGEWLMEPGRFRALFTMAMHTDISGHVEATASNGDAPTSLDEKIRVIPGRSGGRSGDGVAVIPVTGTLMKHVSSLSAGTSLVHLQKALRDAGRNSQVGAVVLDIDSPGGTVAGTFETVAEVVALAGKKPVIAFARDLTASAAYAIASNATSIYANVNTALVGSIGTMLTLYDQSAQFNEAGIEALLFATGPVKGTGTPGAKVTDEQKQYLQDRVNAMQETFDAAVQTGRGFDDEQLAKVRSGAVWTADRAQQLGLIDGVKSFDDVIDEAMDLAAANLNKPAGSQTRTGRAAGMNREEPIMPSNNAPAPPAIASTKPANDDPDKKPEDDDAKKTGDKGKKDEKGDKASTAAAGGEKPSDAASASTAAEASQNGDTGDTGRTFVVAPDGTTVVQSANPATLAELKAALPDSDAAFRLDCLEKGYSLEQAKDIWMDRLSQRVKDLEAEKATLEDATETLRGHEGVEAQVEGKEKSQAQAQLETALRPGTARFAAGFAVPGSKPTRN